MEYDDSYDSMTEPARVRVEMGSRVFVGDVRIPDIAFKSRVSDIVNDRGRRFLPLANVEAVDGVSGQVVSRSPFILLRLDAVDLIMPLREPGTRPPLD
jgi:hypothetical protein